MTGTDIVHVLRLMQIWLWFYCFKSARNADQMQITTVYLPYLQISSSLSTCVHSLSEGHWQDNFHNSLIPCRILKVNFQNFCVLCRIFLDNLESNLSFVQLFLSLIHAGLSFTEIAPSLSTYILHRIETLIYVVSCYFSIRLRLRELHLLKPY